MEQPSDGLCRRLRRIRVELYGEQGGPVLAEALDLPSRAWHRYESGDVVPATVILRFIALTGACPHWLLTGELPQYDRTEGRAWRNPVASSQ
jgi:hypothetical protein